MTDGVDSGEGLPEAEASALQSLEGSAARRGLHHVRSDEDYANIPQGRKYLAPDNSIRTKPWELSSPEDYKGVPEGGRYLDPEGQLRTKAFYQSLNPEAEMLYRFANSPDTRTQVLEKYYPGQVTTDVDGEPIVNDNGVLRRAGKSPASTAGFLASEIAPTAGVIGGTIFGGLPGAVGGAVLGTGFNQSVLSLAGIHQSEQEALTELGMSGGFTAAGGAVGHIAAKTIPRVMEQAAVARLVKAAAKGENLSAVAETMGITPERVRKLLGAAIEDVERSSALADQGVKVAPSRYAKEAPLLRKIVEQFDPVFRGRDVFVDSAVEHYDRTGAEILGRPEIGVTPIERLTAATKAVSSREAGEIVQATARHDLAYADARLEDAAREATDALSRRESERGADIVLAKRNLTSAFEQAANAAQTVFDGELSALDRDLDQVIQLSRIRRNAWYLWQSVADRFDAFNRAIRQRASTLYDRADRMAGNALPESGGLTNIARDFVQQLPEDFRSKYPGEFRQLLRMGGLDPTTLEPIEGAEPARPTFGQLRSIRSWLRQGIDYDDLTPNMRTGSKKYLEREVNRVLHAADAAPELRDAVRLLDQADAFYARNIPRLNDKMVKTVMKGLENGVPGDPELLAKTLFRPGRTAPMTSARRIMGEPMWALVRAADERSMLANSLDVRGQIDSVKYAAQVEDRIQNGILDAAYTPERAAYHRRLADNAKMLKGKLPIRVQPGDTMASIIERMDQARKQADAFAAAKPLQALKEAIAKDKAEVSDLQKKSSKAVRDAIKERSPLAFLYDNSMSHQATAAADKILESPDKIIAAANEFGADSDEFNALRKVFAWRFFQRPIEKITGMRAQLASPAGVMTEEVQALMFPGVTRSQMKALATDIEWLLGGAGNDVGTSFAAQTRVFNPEKSLPVKLPGLFWQVPGTQAGARILLGKLYASVTDGVTNPTFLAWLAGRLNGTPAEREIARQVFNRRLRKIMSAGAGEAAAQIENGNTEEQ